MANAWVEALASGTPIVIPDAGAARQVVTGPVAGRIVAREPAAVAQGIAAVLSQPVDPGATQATVDAFSWERNARELHAHLLGLVAARR